MGAVDSVVPVESIDNGAGYRLRCARENSGLSIRDAASALNLMVSHVRAIEADRYVALASDKQFLRHLRDYADLVDLDAHEIVDIYRSQAATVAKPIEAQPAENTRRNDYKWYAVGALAIACVCLGIWSLKPSSPAESSRSMAKSGDETAAEKPSKTSPLVGNERLARNDTIEAAISAVGLPTRIVNAASFPPVIVSSTETTTTGEKNTSGTDETAARSDQAALEPKHEQSGKDTINTSSVNAIAGPTNAIAGTKPGKNALLAVGAKPLSRTLIALKDEDVAQAKR